MLKQLTSSAKRLAIPLLAMAALAPAAAQANTLQYIDTSSLWADADSYHACLLSNTSHASISVYVALLDYFSGAVISGSLTTPVTVAAGTTYELSSGGGTAQFARCRFGVYNPAIVRANLTVFHPSGGDYPIYATSEAR